MSRGREKTFKTNVMLRAGVIAVAVFGLYGAATSKWDLSTKVEESGAFDAFWDSIAFITNAIVFFYSGAACINFFVRCICLAPQRFCADGLGAMLLSTPF